MHLSISCRGKKKKLMVSCLFSKLLLFPSLSTKISCTSKSKSSYLISCYSLYLYYISIIFSSILGKVRMPLCLAMGKFHPRIYIHSHHSTCPRHRSRLIKELQHLSICLLQSTVPSNKKKDRSLVLLFLTHTMHETCHVRTHTQQT